MLDADLLASYNAVRKTPNTGIFCHAPFASVNFSQNGDATVCCYNRKYVLGTYPAASLDEIWRGPSARELRDAMSRNELPRGCDICLSQFESSNFSGLRARSFDHLAEKEYQEDPGGAPGYPKLMEFEISNICNLECTMCNGFFSSSIRRHREKLPPLNSPYDDAFVRQLEPFIPHLQEARFLGGEPFLVKAYYQIWESIVRLNPGMKVTVTTNGTILNDRVKGLLEKLNADIIVSIDSMSRHTYEEIRVNANYPEVMEHIAYFREYATQKGTSLTFAVCPMRQNWLELSDIVDYCSSSDIHVFFNTVVFPGDAAFRYMAHDALDQMVECLQSVQLSEGTEIARGNNQQYEDLIRQIAGYRDTKAKFRDAEPEDLPVSEWSLETSASSQATLDRSVEAEGRLSVRGQGANTFWLVSPPMPFKSSRRYVLEFRARADERQSMTVVCLRSDPREDIGLKLRFGLTPTWERFEIDFVPRADTDEGRLAFVVIDSVGDIELSDISLRVANESGEEHSTPAAVHVLTFVR